MQKVYVTCMAYSPTSEYKTCKSILCYKMKNSNTSVIITETKNMNQRAV